MAGSTYMLGVVYVLWVFFTLPRIVQLSELLSLHKPTTQSTLYRPSPDSPITYPSKNAVDGNTSQRLDQNSCTHQALNQPEVWWRVDLQTQVTIEKVDIYYRHELYWDGWRNRFAGYEVYLTNTTDRSMKDRCFIDESQHDFQIKSNVSHTECNGTARYVIIYNHREAPKRRPWYDHDALLELCEVRVYGCEEGRYGNGNCDQTCSSNCPGSLCHPSSGNCLYCGDNTYTRLGQTSCWPCPDSCAGPCDNGGNCDECKGGLYGVKCPFTCPDTCGSNTCEKTSGDCYVCPAGSYGPKCQTPCPDTCGNNTCEKTRGDCSVCPAVSYGPKCQTPCPDTCGNNTCEKTGGHCSGGCVDGKRGDRCHLPCSDNCTTCAQDEEQCSACIDGYHGTSCSVICGHCEDKRCDITTANCKTSCLKDWIGPRCDVKDKQSGGIGSNVGPYALAGAGVVVLLALVIIAVCIAKRRFATSRESTTAPSVTYEMPHSSNNSQNHSDGSQEHVYLTLENRSSPKKSGNPENVYYNEGPISCPVIS